MEQLFLMAIAAVLLAVVPVQSFAQYGSGPGAASENQLARCDEIEIDRNQCTESTILARERFQYAKETAYGNDAEGSGMPYFQGIETIGAIGALGAIYGGIAGAFFVMGRRTRQTPA